VTTAPAASSEEAASRARFGIDLPVAIRAVVIAALFVFVIVPLPSLVGSDWLTTFASTAIYAIVALGFGILYGRVGMISLGQVALLSVGVWIGARLAYGTGMPYPILLLATGALTCVVGTLVGLPSLRLSGLYLALITLMFAGATTIVLSVTDFPNGGGGFKGRSATGALTTETPPVRRPSIAEGDVAFYR
jgi:branched-chain amino acid transport system permease protein